MKSVVIIGNGISGVTAARHIRKRSNAKITIISSETKYFFSRTALMYVYMGHMKFEHTQPFEPGFWEKNRIDLIQDRVEAIDTEGKSLALKSGGTLAYDELILATGSKPNKFGWPGQDLDGVQGLYSYQELESMEKISPRIKRAVVIGGGLIGIEMCEMFLSRGIPVTFLVREKFFWGGVLPKEEASLVEKHIREHHVDLRMETELDSILDDGNGRVKGIKTKYGELIDCEFVGLTVGVSPNIEFLKSSGIELGRGIMVDRHLRTSADNVYAIGDCAQFREPLPNRRPVEQVWYTGRLMGEAVAKTITGTDTIYEPGFWFNSAKFFDIEYQTYGNVWSQLKEGETDFYWEHDDGKKCIKIVFDESSKKFKGINTFGIRMRHEIFDQWLQEGRDVNHVVSHLKDANFDPEFYSQYEKEIVSEFNRKNGTNLQVQKKSLARIFGF